MRGPEDPHEAAQPPGSGPGGCAGRATVATHLVITGLGDTAGRSVPLKEVQHSFGENQCCEAGEAPCSDRPGVLTQSVAGSVVAQGTKDPDHPGFFPGPPRCVVSRPIVKAWRGSSGVFDDGMLTSERLRGLLAAVVALSSDLTLDGVLQRIVDSASELVGARYGFLGVLDGRSERRLGTFAVHGLDDAHQEMIGRLPQGEGLLGLVIDHPEPLRIAHLDDHPSRAGFPRLHPDMTSFLGVPIRVHDRVFGNLYLTEKDDGEGFTSEDEEIAVALASAAGVVIENARLWEQGEYQRRWLLSAAEITTALLQPITRADAVQ
ncbi:MAG: GAF domain-containing protein, partial [Actinomycetales bacterium]